MGKKALGEGLGMVERDLRECRHTCGVQRKNDHVGLCVVRREGLRATKGNQKRREPCVIFACLA